MGWTPSKARLLEKLNAEHESFIRLIEPLTSEQFDRAEMEGAWSVKDTLAHLTAWDKRGRKWIRDAARGKIPRIPEGSALCGPSPVLTRLKSWITTDLHGRNRNDSHPHPPYTYTSR